MEVKGVNGQIRFDGREVTISRKGVLGFLTQGFKGEKSIDVEHISSIQFKNAGLMLNGYIQFAFIGGRESKAGIFDASQDENTVMFSIGQQKVFEQLRDAVKKRGQELRTPSGQPSGVSDEVEKLAGLRDRGILTDEEFQAKKRQLLGL
jgi:hypothetical protein